MIKEEHERRVLHMLRLSGAMDSFQQVDELAGGLMDLPEEMKELSSKLHEAIYSDEAQSEIHTIIAEQYTDYFTPEEVEELIIWFQTPLGKKYAEKSTALSGAMKQIHEFYDKRIQDVFGDMEDFDPEDLGFDLGGADVG